MPGVVVEVQGTNKHLSHSRGFMLIREGDKELHRITYDEILSLVVSSYSCTISNRLMQKLATHGIPMIVAGENFQPLAISLPLIGNYDISSRLRYQISCKELLKKQLWTQLIRKKIEHQYKVLLYLNKDQKGIAMMKRYISMVKSGDTSNIEGQAARKYFSCLFGDDFRRNREAMGINSMLNYGYMVLRSCVARAIVASGLHPSLGIHHKSWTNTMQLADDFMEPFRPIVDYVVYNLCKGDIVELNPRTKLSLCSLLSIDVMTKKGISPLFTSIQYTLQSFVNILMQKKTEIEISAFPKIEAFERIMEHHV